jgi:hypothetical protein
MSVRNYPDVTRIYVDMDGPTADFERAMRETGKTAKELKVIPGFYSHLHPTPGAIEGIHALLDLGYFVMMLTKIPSENNYAAAEKLIWMNKHLPRMKDHTIISPDKGCIGRVRDFLIDDHPEWANAHNFSGMIFQFGGEKIEIKGKPLMGHVSNWENLVEFFTKNKDSIL